MSKVRDLPEIVVLDGNDLLYVVDASEGPNGGRKITKDNLKESVEQSAAEIKTAYESNADTNAFTDAEKLKLFGIEDGATADQVASEVPYDNSESGLTAIDVQDAIDEAVAEAQADFRPSVVSGRILHYTGGTARFDDVFYELVANDILLNQNITLGEVYVDLDGVVKQTASGINAPPLSIVFAKFSTDLNDITSLTDQRVKNTQNLVRGLLSDVRDVRAGAAAVAGDSGRLSDALHKHNILTAAAGTQLANQANAEGSSSSLARADHIHAIPTEAPSSNLTPASTNAEGAGTSFALGNHTHAIVTALVADISTILPDDAASAGVANNFVRGDHKHAIATDVPVSLTPDAANAEGVSTSFSRADHIHNVPAAAPTTTLSPATSNAEGVGSSFARNDHTHAISTALVGDISTVNAGDAASAGVADTFARGDHMHAVATAAAASQSPDQANAEGASTSLARADHVHNIPAAAPTTPLSPATADAEGVGSSFARNDHTHSVATALVGNITTILPDDSAAAGTSDTFTRGDHRHAISTASPSTQNPDQANAEGVSTSFARADHIHNIPADAPTTTLSPATSNSEGVGTSFSRNDHTHEVATALVAAITTIQPDDAAAAGTSDTFARGDHRHAIVAAAPSNTGTANSEGASTSFARADHVHNTTIANSSATATADDTTTSLTDVLIVSMSLTPAAGTYAAMFSSSGVNSGNGTSRFFVSIYSGGAQVTHSEREYGVSGGANAAIHTNAIITVNGAEAIEARWRAVAGTNTIHERSLTLIRLGS